MYLNVWILMVTSIVHKLYHIFHWIITQQLYIDIHTVYIYRYTQCIYIYIFIYISINHRITEFSWVDTFETTKQTMILGIIWNVFLIHYHHYRNAVLKTSRCLMSSVPWQIHSRAPASIVRLWSIKGKQGPNHARTSLFHGYQLSAYTHTHVYIYI